MELHELVFTTAPVRGKSILVFVPGSVLASLYQAAGCCKQAVWVVVVVAADSELREYVAVVDVEGRLQGHHLDPDTADNYVAEQKLKKEEKSK